MDMSNKNNNNYKVAGDVGGIMRQRMKAGSHYDPQQQAKINKKSEQFTCSKLQAQAKNQQNDQNPPKGSLVRPTLLKSKPNGGAGGAGVSSDWHTEENPFSRCRISSNKGNPVVASAVLEGSVGKALDKIIDSDVRSLDEEEDDDEGEDSQETNTPATAQDSLVSTCSSSYLLARVDPIVDFFTVDDELLGRFRICSCSTITTADVFAEPSTLEGGGIPQAIIFKIRTTSPNAFWVRPIYGLMRPNVICWVEVKCDMKRISVAMNSRAKLATKTMDEFLIEFCPVPGAMSTMTCDLYTSSVHSNLPELLNIWERAEKELTQQNEQQQWNGYLKEYHRVSCRFQRQNLKSFFGQSLGQLQKLPPTIPSQALQKDSEETDITLQLQGERNNNNNVKNFQWDPSKVTAVKAEELAREFPYQPNHLLSEEEQRLQDENSDLSGKKKRPDNGNQCCSSRSQTIRRLWCLTFVLALMLFASLLFILYTTFGPTMSYNINSNSPPLYQITNTSSDNAKTTQPKYPVNDSINELDDNSNKTDSNG